jgi:PAS domain S-box-containing protein
MKQHVTTDVIEDPERLRALRATGLLEHGTVLTGLDRLTRLATRLLDVPTAVVTLIEPDRQVFTSHHGLSGELAEKRQTPLSYSFCRYVVADAAPMVVGDARTDGRLSGNPAIGEHRAIAYAGFPLRDPEGHVLGSFCVFDGEPRAWTERDVAILQDLAQEAEAEIALRISQDRLSLAAARTQAILDTCPDAFISMDHTGRVTAWNHAAEVLFGFPTAEALGRTLGALIIPARLRDAHARGMARVAETGTSVLAGQRTELTAVDRSGHEFPVEMSLSVDNAGDRPVFHAFLHDISERRELADQREQHVVQLERLDRMKDELVAVVSHELRNPVGVIAAYTEELLADPILARRRELKVIERSSAHLLNLIQDLLDLARLDAGHDIVDPRPVPITRLLREAVQAHQPAAGAADVTIVADLSPAPVIEGDAGRLRQVLDNLLSNAVKYTPAGGTVTVTGRDDGDTVTVTVADTGIGIPAEQYPKLFTRFFRASTATSRGIKGTGLGLAVTHAVVTAHHGAIMARPRPQGGTEFVVTLPVRATAA